MTPGSARPPTRSPRRAWRWYAVAGVALTVGIELLVWSAAGREGPRRTEPAQGECVAVTAPSSADELRAGPTGCDTEPSFTVAKLADRTGKCLPEGYTRFRPPFADVGTGRLCLVPNLVVGHCYRFGVPTGMWDVTDCATAEAATVKVTERIDGDEQNACQADVQAPIPGIRTVSGPRALRYPGRTYCYATPR